MQHVINGLCGFLLFANTLDHWASFFNRIDYERKGVTMSNRRMIAIMLFCVSILSINALAEDEKYSVNISVNKFLGSYLVNETGFALYYYQNDSAVHGMSICDGDCAKMWPPFYVQNLTLPQSLNP